MTWAKNTTQWVREACGRTDVRKFVHARQEPSVSKVLENLRNGDMRRAPRMSVHHSDVTALPTTSTSWDKITGQPHTWLDWARGLDESGLAEDIGEVIHQDIDAYEFTEFLLKHRVGRRVPNERALAVAVLDAMHMPPVVPVLADAMLLEEGVVYRLNNDHRSFKVTKGNDPDTLLTEPMGKENRAVPFKQFADEWEGAAKLYLYTLMGTDRAAEAMAVDPWFKRQPTAIRKALVRLTGEQPDRIPQQYNTTEVMACTLTLPRLSYLEHMLTDPARR